MQDEAFFKRSALLGIALLVILSVVLVLTPSSAQLVTGRFTFGEYRSITFVGALTGAFLIIAGCAWYVNHKLRSVD